MTQKKFKLDLTEIDILKVLDLPEVQMPEGLVEFVKDMETYTDTDALEEHMYSQDIFVDKDYNWPADLIDCKRTIAELMREHDCAYVRFTKI